MFIESYQLQTNYRSSKCMQAMCPRLLHSSLWHFCDHHFSSLVGIQSLRKLLQKIVVFCYGNSLLWTFKIRNVMWSPLQTTAMLLRPKQNNHKPCVQDPLVKRNSSNAESPKYELPFTPSTII